MALRWEKALATVTLYHYVHCPFCLRARMALGFLNIPWKSVVLPYDDEETPIKFTGKKMLPILTSGDGHHHDESLDIIERLDTADKLSFGKYKNHAEFAPLLLKLGDSIHPLCMPYWIYTKEFDPKAQEYFRKKKEKTYGPFSSLALRRKEFLLPLEKHLAQLEKNLIPFYENTTLSILDLLLASHLWGMYVVVEFQFSSVLHDYLQRVKTLCRFDYHRDLWRT